MIRFLRFSDADFEATFRQIEARGESVPAEIGETVDAILAEALIRPHDSVCSCC